MPVTITLTDMKVENLVIYKVKEDGQTSLVLGLNYTLTNAEGVSEGDNRQFELTAQQKTQILDFVKPYIQEVGTDLDVNIPAWAED